jgi:hypothetical protein
MEYCHKGSPVHNKFETKPSAVKVELTVFWNSEGAGATMNSERYTERLNNLKNAS